MNAGPTLNMSEAMRLMQAGDLSAATAAIQRGLKGAASPHSPVGPSAPHPEPIDGTYRVVDETPRTTNDAECLPSRAREQGRDSTAEQRTQFGEHTYKGSAGVRRYKLFIPSAYRRQPLPLIVMLHGCTQTPDDFALGTRMNAWAEERACMVVYPAQAQSANASKCWNWFRPGDQHRDQGEPSIIAGLVRELLLTWGLDRERVYVAGLSAGGAMAVILAREYPDLFAAVGVHSGLPYAAAHDLPSALAAMHSRDRSGPRAAPGGDREWRNGVPTIVFHGELDATVHPSNGEKVASHCAGTHANDDCSTANAASPAVERHAGTAPQGHAFTRTRFTDSAGAVIVEHWLVHGAAHAWSGGDPRGSYTDAKGPDASREMLRFFLDRVRRQRPLTTE